jgi:hypothetical protein
MYISHHSSTDQHHHHSVHLSQATITWCDPSAIQAT